MGGGGAVRGVVSGLHVYSGYRRQLSVGDLLSTGEDYHTQPTTQSTGITWDDEPRAPSGLH